jgi:cysteine desulfurase
MRIYLDHNANTPMRPAVQEALTDFLVDGDYGNPSSVHRAGQMARRELECARARVARLIDASANSIVFTSGGTESNNLAIYGALRAQSIRRRIITTTIEHSSIIAPVNDLERSGFEVIKVPCDPDGQIDLENLKRYINNEAALVTLGLANSETGVIQDVAGISEAVRAAGALFHLDSVQAVGRISVRVEELGCDLMTLSSHKLGGPAGSGALYVRRGVALAPLIFGGPQEAGRRAGTPNLLGALGFGVAAESVMISREEESVRISALSRELFDRLNDSIPGLRLNGPVHNRLQNTLNLTFPGVLGETMLIALDLEGVEVSMGSACAAGAVEPSHVLLAMGRSTAEARSSLRLSLGWSTKPEEIAIASEVIPRVWRRVVESEPVALAEAS